MPYLSPPTFRKQLWISNTCKEKNVAVVVNIAKDISCKPKVAFFLFFLLNVGLRKLGRSLAQKKNYVDMTWKPSENLTNFLSNDCGDQIYISHFREVPMAHRWFRKLQDSCSSNVFGEFKVGISHSQSTEELLSWTNSHIHCKMAGRESIITHWC